MDFEVAKKRVNELTEILNDCIEKYYMGNESDVSDYDYDMMMRELSHLEDEFPDLLKSNSPTHRVGGRVASHFEKVKHNYPMGSISDVFSFEELDAFDTRIKSVFLFLSLFFTITEQKSQHIIYILIYFVTFCKDFLQNY